MVDKVERLREKEVFQVEIGVAKYTEVDDVGEEEVLTEKIVREADVVVKTSQIILILDELRRSHYQFEALPLVHDAKELLDELYRDLANFEEFH